MFNRFGAAFMFAVAGAFAVWAIGSRGTEGGWWPVAIFACGAAGFAILGIWLLRQRQYARIGREAGARLHGVNRIRRMLDRIRHWLAGDDHPKAAEPGQLQERGVAMEDPGASLKRPRRDSR